MDNQWIVTDPDSNQRGRKVGQKEYEFEEDIIYPWGEESKKEAIIDLNDYTQEEIENIISTYGYTLKSLHSDYSIEDMDFLIAECIFEQEI